MRTAIVALGLAVTVAACQSRERVGANPQPVRLVRPAAVALSPLATIGRDIFFDRRLSGSGTVSCATCHDPAYAYGPPPGLRIALGDASGRSAGARAVPSLRYTDRIPAFVIGPDVADAGAVASTAMQMTAARQSAPRRAKTAGVTGPPPLVPRGGFFWDGRAGSFELQAAAPLLNPSEMANGSVESLAAKFAALGYADRLARATGARAANQSGLPRLADEALFAVARFEFEDPSFHPYSSRYDDWLEGKATLSAAELRGLRVFEDPSKGNCAACHLDRPEPDGRPPAFTDWQYEALGVPRNVTLAVNHDPAHFDLGLCGPPRADLAAQPEWCGMFRTPSLRNVATRHVFFHNGVYATLEDVVRFYNFRDTRPELIYPRGKDDGVLEFDDLPVRYRRNVDTTDPPFGRKRGGQPPITDQEMRDVVAFLRALSDETNR